MSEMMLFAHLTPLSTTSRRVSTVMGFDLMTGFLIGSPVSRAPPTLGVGHMSRFGLFRLSERADA
jgi:hypothetical protein